MEYRPLGGTGLKVSHLCLGTMTFGNQDWGCDEATSIEMTRRYLDAGGNFIDVADIYARGQSEVITGKAIAGRRQAVILATKCASPMGSGPNDSGTSRKHILDAVDASLARLGTDFIDLAALNEASRPLPSYPKNFYAMREAMQARYRFGEAKE